MRYNIEEQEDYLKNNSPYEKDDAQWEAMQQRIRAAVLTAARQEAPPKKRGSPFWKLTAAAALLCAILPLGFVLLTRQDTVVAPGNLTLNKTMRPARTAEQMLDNTIGRLNDAELSWLHQLNENEIAETNEYPEN